MLTLALVVVESGASALAACAITYASEKP